MGSFKPGDSVNAYVQVRNTGNTEHTFFVGYSAIGPDGKEYDNNDETGTRVTLAPGEVRTVELAWRVESEAPAGEYDAQLSVWQESDRDQLETSLDSIRTVDVFEVQESVDISADVVGLDIDRGEYAPGDNVPTTVCCRKHREC